MADAQSLNADIDVFEEGPEEPAADSDFEGDALDRLTSEANAYEDDDVEADDDEDEEEGEPDEDEDEDDESESEEEPDVVKPAKAAGSRADKRIQTLIAKNKESAAQAEERSARQEQQIAQLTQTLQQMQQ